MNPALALRAGSSGPTLFPSTPGYVLVVQADGKTIKAEPISSAGGLISFNGRTAPAALPVAGDYSASGVVNDSLFVPGADVADALDALQVQVDALPSALVSFNGRTAPAVIPTAGDYSAQQVSYSGSATGANSKAALDSLAQPFLGTYHVNPAFTGSQTGSASNPFSTIAAAFAFAASLAITRGIIFLAPGATCVENVTFPTTGEWEIAGDMTVGLTGNVSITGNVDMSATASARRTLRGLQVTGNLSGNCSAGTQRILLQAATITGTTTLTATGAGVNRLALGSWSGEAFSGFGAANAFLQGAVSIAGTINGSGGVIFTSLAFTGGGCLVNTLLPPLTTLTGAGGATLYLFNCANTAGGPLAFTASGGGTLVLRPDGVTLAEFERLSLTLTGLVTLVSMVAGRASVSTQVTNIGVTPLTGRLPAGLMVCEACLTLLANGGATAGNAVLNVIYTDATGTLVTEPVTTALNVAGAVGSKARGVLPFSQQPSASTTSASFSVTGITNATALSYRCEVVIRQAS